MPLKEKDLPNEVPSHVLQDDRHDFFLADLDLSVLQLYRR